MPPLSILFLGDTTQPEFQAARACLPQWAAVSCFPDVNRAAEALAEGQILPDLVVVAQTRPGQFSHQTVERLRRLAPLARIVALAGSWCEGEMRSGSPWPATARIYWHQWPARCHQELGRLARGQSCAWALPTTATDDERLLADADSAKGERSRTTRAPDPPSLIRIYSHSAEMAEWLSAACRTGGFSPVWCRDPAVAKADAATAAIFDATDLSPAECDELRQLAAALRPAPVIALLSFPRVEHRDRALHLGAAAVLSKPVAADDLLWQLSLEFRL